MRNLFLLSLVVTTASCSFSKQMNREVVIDSSPKGADVSYLSPSGQFKVIGQTPLTVEPAIIKEWLNSKSEYAVIKVSKSGYVVENLFIDLNGRYKLAYNADLKQVDAWNNKEMEVSSNLANKLAQKVQQINQQVFNKNFDSALKDTELLIDQYPKAHVFYDIKGSILFLKGQRAEAINSYQKSLSLNPDNNEAKKMLEKVKGERQ
jgi:tetratricopeptide (TPR) repeat protein